MDKPLIIDYYTDVLCVWAWIAQRRIDELNSQFGRDIEVRHYYTDIFGNVAQKMDTQWRQRGHYEGFAAHVRESASKFEDAPIHPKIWTEVRPATSANAHLMLKAVELAYSKQQSIDAAFMLRDSFFNQAQDIGNLDTICRLVSEHGLDCGEVSRCIDDGSAMAALMGDYQKAKLNSIKGSPSYVMDGGRQTLYGNVGYRVISTNVEELLKHPQDEASWC